jgi:hypothetical protein
MEPGSVGIDAGERVAAGRVALDTKPTAAQHGRVARLSAVRSRLPAIPLALGLVAIALLPSAPASAQTHMHGMDDEGALHAGNTAPYPTLRNASAANRRRARTLQAATLLGATRFDTLEEAAQLGYVAEAHLSPLYRPGLQHFRKNGVRFWGHLLDAREPQALVFWCPSSGDCRLAAFMYRAPARMSPPTYGGLLGWHRHAVSGSWMTHIWLTNRARNSLAQCAPFNAMHARDPMLAWEPYLADVPMLDDPCPDTTGLHSGMGHVPGMAM